MNTTALSLLQPPEQTDQEPETLDRPDLVRGHTLFELDQIEQAFRCLDPMFVFAHVLVPHPPYVFREDGSMTTPEERRLIPEDASCMRTRCCIRTNASSTLSIARWTFRPEMSR